MRARKWFVFLTVLLLVPCLLTTAWAAQTDFVVDDAGLLTDSEEARLAESAAQIAQRYDCGVYIVTLEDFTELGGGSVRGCAEQYFTAHDYGFGSDDNGVMLLLSMAERDYALIAHGDLANAAFTDYGKDVLSEEFLDDFRCDDWYAGFGDYLSVCEEFLREAEQGTPVDVGGGSGSGAVKAVLLVLVPLLIAGIACGVMAAMMKTARRQTNADGYIARKGIHITDRYDRFVNRTVVRERIDNDHHSGGGTRVNSGGFSGKSGKF